MKRFKVWGSTLVHVVRVVDAETLEDALDAFDGAVEVDGNRVKACDERNLLEVVVDDEWVLCGKDEAIEVAR